MNQTPNYSLNQWERSDRVLMEDFNEDNAKIDAAVAALAAKVSGKAEASALTALAQTVAGKAERSDCLRIITGSYTGTGVLQPIHYTIGARPRMLFLATNNTHSSTYATALFAVDGMELRINSNGASTLGFNRHMRFDDTGFTVDHSLEQNQVFGFNCTGKTQTYWVLC